MSYKEIFSAKKNYFLGGIQCDECKSFNLDYIELVLL